MINTVWSINHVGTYTYVASLPSQNHQLIITVEQTGNNHCGSTCPAMSSILLPHLISNNLGGRGYG